MFRSYSEKLFRPNLKSLHSQGNEQQWFKCDLCDLDDEDAESSWRTETDVELHRKDTHFNYIYRQLKENRGRFCTVCMKLQDSKSALISHVKQRHLLSSPNAQRVEREIFICDYCDHIFFNKDVLEAHVQYMHLWSHDLRVGKTFSCPRCKKIRQLKSLWFHMQNHDIPSVTICDICLTHCPSIADLMSHVKDHPMYFKCETCNFQTLKDSIFEKHLQMHKAAPLKKDVSTLELSIADVFTQHSNSYSNNVKYNIHHSIKGLIIPPLVRICTLCREICIDKVEMLEHISRDHTHDPEPLKQPSYTCHCGLEFASRVMLKHHTFKTHGLQQKTAVNIDNQPISMNKSDETNERNEANEQDRIDTEVQQVAIEIGEPSPEPEMTNEGSIEMAQDENSGEELVYIYTTIDDDDMVVEEDNEEIVGF